VTEIPLFPLRTVLFPGGSLRLRIFEPRYLDMVSRCLREDIGFGVVLIRQGSEVGPAETYEVGTLARISDWYTLTQGLLGITALGIERLRVRNPRRQQDGLMLAEVEMRGAERHVALEARHAGAIAALETLQGLAGDGEPKPEAAKDGGVALVAARLAELLPVSATQKQAWLEIDDPVERLDAILPAVALLRVRRPTS
jgi:Lon protease-like protein